MAIPFRAVIFDLDGLMLDTESISRLSWQQAGRDLGYEISDELFVHFVGRTSVDCDAILRKKWGASFPFARMWKRIAHHWDQHVSTRGIPLKAGLVELLDFLEAQKVPKAIATSSGRDHALSKLGGLARRFDVLATGDEVYHGKPAPDIFLLAAERLNVAPSDCLALEDSLAGLQAARSAGMYNIMVPDLLAPNEQVEHVCASLHEVEAWLKNPARKKAKR